MTFQKGNKIGHRFKKGNQYGFKKGEKKSEETRRKMSEAKKRKNPGGFKMGHQVFSPFEKGNQFWKQRKITRGVFKKGRIVPQYVVQKVIEARKSNGKAWHSEETIRKMSERREQNPTGFCKHIPKITEEMMEVVAEACKSIPGLQRHVTSLPTIHQQPDPNLFNALMALGLLSIAVQ